MSFSTQANDRTSKPYEIVKEVSSDKTRQVLVKKARRSNIHESSFELPPSPAATEDMSRVRPSSSSSSFSSSDLPGSRIGEITIPLTRGAPGDEAIVAKNKTEAEQEAAKRRSQYFGQVFAVREPQNSARDRLAKECLVLVEIKTNVIVQDEYTFITAMSSKLSELYKRPETSVVVTLRHTTCLLFGGSFEPAYVMIVSCLQAQMTPIFNMRNGAVLQQHMTETLGVVAERGMVKFEPMIEANFATNGKTLKWQIDDHEKETNELDKSTRRLSTATKDKRKSTKSMRNMRTSTILPTHTEQQLNSHTYGGIESAPPPPPIPTSRNAWDERANAVRKMSRRKSFSAWIFGKGQQSV